MKASGNGWEIQTFEKQPLAWPSWWRRQAYTLEMRWFKPNREHNEIPYVTWPGQPIRIEVTPPCASRQGRDVPLSETMWIISRPSLDLARPWASTPRLTRPEKMNGHTLPPQREDKDAGDVSKLVWFDTQWWGYRRVARPVKVGQFSFHFNWTNKYWIESSSSASGCETKGEACPTERRKPKQVVFEIRKKRKNPDGYNWNWNRFQPSRLPTSLPAGWSK